MRKMTDAFRHHDGEQTIVFGPGALDAAHDLIGTDYALLSTERAVRSAPALAERATSVVIVPPGPVDEVAAAVLAQIDERPIVALGGGRVTDAAKAVAAATRQPGPVAIPTSLSGAEMTGAHRHAQGVPGGTPHVRARVVINDPALSASQPEDQLAASSGNALGHALTALTSSRTTPIARAVALDAITRFGRAWTGAAPDRQELALAALLSGWAVDRSGLGPHHALSQTAVRLGRLSHAGVNVALLPHTVRATRDRLPDALTDADRALGMPLEALAETLRERSRTDGLAVLTTDDEMLQRAVDVAAGRPELRRIPRALTPAEVRAIYLAAA